MPAVLSATSDATLNARLGIGVLFAIGAWRCFALARTPRVNRPASIGLGLVLGAGAACTFVARALPIETFGPAPTFVALFAWLACVAVGVVLAGVGLFQVLSRPSDYDRGLGLALGALGLGGFTILASIGIALAPFVSQLTIPSRVRHASPAEPGTVLDRPAHGFRLRVPPAPWVQIDTRQVNPAATLGFYHVRKKGPLILIAETLSPSMKMDAEAASSLATASFRSAAPDYEKVEEGWREIAGIRGYLVRGSATFERTPSFHEAFVVSRGDRLFQFIFTFPSKGLSRSQVDDEMTIILSGFEATDVLARAGAADAVTKTATAGDAASADDGDDATPLDIERVGGAWVSRSLNFRLAAPPSPWVEYDVRKNNPSACLGFVRARPQMFETVIAEVVGDDSVTASRIAEVAMANLAAASARFERLDRRPKTIAGIEGVRQVFQARIDATDLWFVNWAGVRNGYAYQVVLSSPTQNDRREAEAQADLVASGFSLLDPERLAVVGTPTADYVSPAFGFTVRARDAGWTTPTAGGDASLASAEFAGARGDAGLAAYGATLGGLSAAPEAVAASLLRRLGLTFPGRSVVSQRPIEDAGARGLEVDILLKEGDDRRLRARTLARDGIAYAAVAWAPAGAVKADPESLARTLSRFRLSDTPPPPVDPAALRGDDRARSVSFLNRIGLEHFREDRFAEALAFFRAAARVDPEDTVLFDNALSALRRLDRSPEALAALDERDGRTPPDARLLAKRGYLLTDVDRRREALDCFARAFASVDHDDVEDLETYAALLEEHDRRDDALAAVDRFLAAHDAARAAVLRAQVLGRRDGVDAGVSALRERARAKGHEEATQRALLEMLAVADRHLDVVAACKEAEAGGHDAAYVRHARARSEVDLHWYEAAKDSLDEALRLDPAHEEARNLLARVESWLGAGDRSAIRDPIEAVPAPDSLLRLLEAPAPSVPTAGASAVILHAVTGHFIAAGQEHRRTEHRRVRVLDARGASDYSTFEFVFDPTRERAHVGSLEVRDPSGAVVASGTTRDAFCVDERDGEAATRRKVLMVPVPGLSPGAEVRISVTFRRLAPLERVPFVEWMPSRRIPVARAALFVRGEPALVRHEERGGARAPDAQGDALLWLVDAPGLVPSEPESAHPADYLPRVRLSDARAAWDALAREYLDDIADRLAPDPAIEAHARAILAAAAPAGDGAAAGTTTTAVAKVAALVRAVQRDLSYMAIEFGPRARIPKPAADTLRERLGDCKDHALLVHHLLRAAGVPSHLALVRTSGPLSVSLPALDAFDHMVVYVPGASPAEGRAVDATDDGLDPALPVHEGLFGRTLLVLDAAAPRLVRLPDRAPADARIRIRRVVRISGADAEVDESIEFGGAYSSWARGRYGGIPEEELRRRLQSLLSGGAEIEVRSAAVERMDAAVGAPSVRVGYVVRDRFHAAGPVTVGALPAALERRLLAVEFARERSSPIEPAACLIESDVTLRAPAGCVVALADAGRSVEGAPFLEARASVAGPREGAAGPAAGEVLLRTSAALLGGRHAPEAYGRYRELAEAALAALEAKVRIEAAR